LVVKEQFLPSLSDPTTTTFMLIGCCDVFLVIILSTNGDHKDFGVAGGMMTMMILLPTLFLWILRDDGFDRVLPTMIVGVGEIIFPIVTVAW
jgi:hypothetical protein